MSLCETADTRTELKDDYLKVTSFVVAYFRCFGFLDYNVKVENFVNIVSTYIAERDNIKFGDKSYKIDVFDDKFVRGIDCIDENFIVVVGGAPQYYAFGTNPDSKMYVK